MQIFFYEKFIWGFLGIFCYHCVIIKKNAKSTKTNFFVKKKLPR